MDAEILKSIGLVIGGATIALAPYVKKWMENKQLSNHFDQNIKARSEIKSILDEIRIKCMATRVNIMDYHNGKESIMGVPFNYVSMFSESCDRLYKPLITEIQQQPIEPAIPLLIRLVENKDRYIFTTTNDINPEIAILQSSYGCAASYSFMITNSIAGGTLVVSYANPPSKELSPSEILWVKAQALQIHNLRSKIKKHK